MHPLSQRGESNDTRGRPRAKGVFRHLHWFVPLAFILLLLALTLPTLLSLPAIGNGIPEAMTRTSDGLKMENVSDEYARSEIVWQKFNQFAAVYTQRSFQWQETVSIVMFFVSILFPGAGLYFAWIQFQDASATEGKMTKIPAQEEEINFDTSVVKFVVKTRTLATFMVTISLVYLVVYLHFVYSIQTVQVSPPVPYIQPQASLHRYSSQIDNSQNPAEVPFDEQE